MSIFDGVLGNVVNQFIGNLGVQTDNPLVGVALGLIQEHGGIGGIVDKFSQSGLAAQAESWVSSGQNLPISVEQLQSVLGSDAVTNVASKLGIDPTQFAEGIAQYLPQVIDKLTPNGTVDESHNELIKEAASLFSRS